MKPDAAMIFAAGFGTRMGALTQDRPKPMVPVGGRPMIDHALDLINAAGHYRIVVNTHYFAEQISTHLADQPNVRCVSEQPDILDTGGGLRHALPLLGKGPVITLNPDALWLGENPIPQLVNAWQPDRMDGLMAMVPVATAQAYTGVGDFFLDPSHRPVRRSDAARAPFVFGGLSILKTEGLHQIRDRVFSVSRLWDQMSATGRLYGLVIDSGWVDLGHPGGAARADALLTGDADV